MILTGILFDIFHKKGVDEIIGDIFVNFARFGIADFLIVYAIFTRIFV